MKYTREPFAAPAFLSEKMISRKDAIVIASRVLAVYFFAWSIDNRPTCRATC
jgi:hypothetical protein